MTMAIKLARIDQRLIHGQVATTWTKATGIDHILVVSDEVAKDKLRVSLLKQATPPGVRAHVLPIMKMAQIYQNPKFDSFKSMLLFTNPEDVLKLVQAGVDLKSVNIGNTLFDKDRKMINKAIAVSTEDVQAYKELDKLGVELEARQLATDTKVPFMGMLKKANVL
ncbi:PTS fructose transporter subunit IIB [Lactiplantibacillus garii]|uniref:PTS fructose transporter subunit IIB n=1 Tax=Lactiplantibacillus garii TaxID=2306423 RepID=A0A3R8KHR7_9LACO|nr:PTS sugar transporter subunit IIB [Lactiplantibacillus garii]RRK10090.1 PTS fructose transporter subunit IIB [Lactiplantibacillus garii]